MKYINRHLENTVLSLSKSYSAILLTGPRQSGKTTMLRRLAEREGGGRGYVSLDDLSERSLAKNDPAMFFKLHKPPVLIDEIQYAPELFTYIKIHIDENHAPGAFWMTGSQIFSLMRGVSESLSGRVALLRMPTLSQREIAGAPPMRFRTDYEMLSSECEKISPVGVDEMFSRIWRGSMPALVGEMYEDREIYYSSYVSTYIERDVRELSNGIDALNFNRFVTSVAARTAQTVNYSSMVEDADITAEEAKRWLNILETLGIVFLLHPYSNNVLKRTVKTPKIYFYDTGLVTYLTKWSSPAVAMNGAMSGALFENFTVSEILKGYQNTGREPFMYFYRDRDAKEIDLVMEGDGMLCPIEIKKTATPTARMLHSFGVIDKAPQKRGTGALICMADKLGAISSDNLIVPVWML
ncbi:MAG: ATP-binding protein [Firmicutes bacterium]|nr:ATP-binding protein [Bacillota bacterium]